VADEQELGLLRHLSHQVQKRSCWSRQGASTRRAGRARRIELEHGDTRAIARQPLLPAREQVYGVFFLPGGRAMTCTPESEFSSPLMMILASPPPTARNMCPKWLFTVSNVPAAVHAFHDRSCGCVSSVCRASLKSAACASRNCFAPGWMQALQRRHIDRTSSAMAWSGGVISPAAAPLWPSPISAASTGFTPLTRPAARRTGRSSCVPPAPFRRQLAYPVAQRLQLLLAGQRDSSHREAGWLRPPAVGSRQAVLALEPVAQRLLQ